MFYCFVVVYLKNIWYCLCDFLWLFLCFFGFFFVCFFICLNLEVVFLCWYFFLRMYLFLLLLGICFIIKINSLFWIGLLYLGLCKMYCFFLLFIWEIIKGVGKFCVWKFLWRVIIIGWWCYFCLFFICLVIMSGLIVIGILINWCGFCWESLEIFGLFFLICCLLC